MLNCHKFDPALEKAVLFAVGNTLVCDDLNEAKHLSWTGERFKGKLCVCVCRDTQTCTQTCGIFL